MKKNFISYIFTLIFSISVVYAQPYTLRSLSGSEGLADLVVSSLYRDSCGYLWIGTATSVERFDGVYLKHYPIFTSNERWKWVNVFVETSNNQIWVGTDGGFWQVGSDKMERIAPEVIKNGVRSIVKDDKDTLYIGSESGLHIYKDGQIETILLDSNLFSNANFINGLHLGKDRILWLITKNGLYSMDLESRKTTHYPNNLVLNETDFSYRNIVRIDSTLYLGTMGNGILSFDIQTKKFQPYIDVGCNVIRSLTCDEKDMLYVGTDGNGAHFISTRQNKIIRSFCHESKTEKGLRSNSVYSVLVDGDGLLWFGLYQLGLDYTVYQNQLFSVYNTSFFNSKDIPVRTVYIGKNDKLIGSRNGLFYIDEDAGEVLLYNSNKLRSNIIMCTYAFQDKIYIGTYGGGMYIFDPKTKEVKDFAPEQRIPFRHGDVFCINSDEDNRLWIGTSNGVYCYKNGTLLRHFTSSNSQLPEGNVYAIYFDSVHKGWICTESGFCIWDPFSMAIKANVFPEGFAHKEKVHTVYEDSNHELYFLPYKGNIFVSDLSMNSFRWMAPDTPLKGKNAMCIIEDKKGWLWIGTDNGLYRYDKKDTFIPYNFADGIPSPIFLSCTPVIDEKGDMWFGNAKGMLGLPADWENKEKKIAHKVGISLIRTNGQLSSAPITRCRNGGSEVFLDASQNNVTICFSGFTFTIPDYMAYEYKMEGKDKEWQTLIGQSEVTYYDMSAGRYVFKVRRMGESGSESSLCIHILSPVDWRLWGSVLFIVALLFSTAIYIWRRKNVSKSRFLGTAKEGKLLVEEKYKTGNLPADECKRLAEKLKEVMQKERPYTNPDLKMTDLAAIIGVSSYTLSYLFNQYLKCNYYDYINDCRITEFKCLVDKGEHNKYTLDALIELCGFNSRTTFFRCFKKANGITPGDYIKSVENTGK